MANENTFLKSALGLAIITIILLLSFALDTRGSPSITGLTLDISVIADLSVAAGTIVLAFVTYRSVKTSEINAAIARDALELQRLSFSKEQVIDQIKTVFDRVISDVTNDLAKLKRNRIECVFINSDLGMAVTDAYFLHFKPLDLSLFESSKFQRQAEPALLSIKQSYPELYIKLQERHFLLLKVDSTMTSFLSGLDKSEEQITNIIKENVSVDDIPMAIEDENGWVDYVDNEVIYLDLENGNYEECSVSTFRNMMIAMMIYDRWDPIEKTSVPFRKDVATIFLELKTDLSDIADHERVEELKITIDAHLKNLREIDEQIHYSANTIRNDYIIRYSLTAEDLKSNNSR